MVSKAVPTVDNKLMSSSCTLVLSRGCEVLDRHLCNRPYIQHHHHQSCLYVCFTRELTAEWNHVLLF